MPFIDRMNGENSVHVLLLVAERCCVEMFPSLVSRVNRVLVRYCGYPDVVGCCCRAIKTEPEVGFSDAALQARKVILEGAVETLGTSNIRREYDERLQIGAIEEDIPGKYVAGALILLHEAGQYDVVSTIGREWLFNNSRHRSKKDVASIVGCSLLSIARGMIDARDSLIVAKDALHEANNILVEFGGAYEVEEMVEKTLDELGPRLALEMISHNNRKEREEGIQLLPMAMQKLKKDAKNDRRAQQAYISYIDRVRQILTAEELINLYNMDNNAFEDPRELYYVAVAHIAAGCHNIDAALILASKNLLLRAERLSKDQEARVDGSGAVLQTRKIAEEAQRRAMALCCCELLLGDSGMAAEVLGLRSDPMTCDRQILTFIRVR